MKFAKAAVVVVVATTASLCDGAPQNPIASALAPLADGFSSLFQRDGRAVDVEQKQAIARDYGHEDHGYEKCHHSYKKECHTTYKELCETVYHTVYHTKYRKHCTKGKKGDDDYHHDDYHHDDHYGTHSSHGYGHSGDDHHGYGHYKRSSGALVEERTFGDDKCEREGDIELLERSGQEAQPRIFFGKKKCNCKYIPYKIHQKVPSHKCKKHPVKICDNKPVKHCEHKHHDHYDYGHYRTNPGSQSTSGNFGNLDFSGFDRSSYGGNQWNPIKPTAVTSQSPQTQSYQDTAIVNNN